MKVKVNCFLCGKEFEKIPSIVKDRNFCCKEHRQEWFKQNFNVPGHGKGGKHPYTSEMLRKRNKTLFQDYPGALEKNAAAKRGKGSGKSYTKYFGRHEHRIVAENIIGRPLNKNEIVHHINGDKRDNRPENLLVCKNQSEHAKLHELGKKNEQTI